MIGQKMPSPYKGLTMQKMVAARLVENGAGINQTVTASLSPAESDRNWRIQQGLIGKTFSSFDHRTRVALPHDQDESMGQRSQEWRRQLAQPWESAFMVTPTDGKRLNNMSQTSFVQQRRLTVGSTYGQWYAFMHALAAAFGTLQQ